MNSWTKLGLVGVVALSLSQNCNTERHNKERILSIQVSEAKKRVLGIDTRYLEDTRKYYTHFVDNYEYLSRADSAEKSTSWIPFEEMDGLNVKRAMYTIAMLNTHTIYGVNNTPLEELDEKYIPLKKLLTELNKIYSSNDNSNKKVKDMYNKIKSVIKSGKTSVRTRGIVSLVSQPVGDCGDIVPAFYSLLTYYGFDTYMRFGKETKFAGKTEGLHSWITVDTDLGSIDLDPYKHIMFVPLKERNYFCEKTKFEKELQFSKEDEEFYDAYCSEKKIR